MHVGRRYPYLWAFWAVETQYWPNYAPRHFLLSGPLGNGSLWDRLNTSDFLSAEGFVCGPLGGDAQWNFDLGGGWTLVATIKKDTLLHPKQYRVRYTIDDGSGHVAHANGLLSPTGGSVWVNLMTITTVDPPWSLPGTDSMPMVPAYWANIP